MKVRASQFAVSEDPDENLAFIANEVDSARDDGVRLLVLPEGVISRNPHDDDAAVRGAQPIDGPFVSGLIRLSLEGVAIAGTFHLRENSIVLNVALVIDGGQIIHRYDKIHLYDAFNSKESDRVTPGTEAPVPFDIEGIRFGIITCYDVRFPEIARDLTLKGAQAILVPAAWVRGPLKEDHWRSMLVARALENTVYVVGCGESNERNIGMSMTIDPLGAVLSGVSGVVGRADLDLDPGRVVSVRASLPVIENMKYRAPVLAE